jgi:hypothetical protein
MSVGAIIIIAIAASGVLMMRFRKRWQAKINICLHQPDHEPVRWLAAGLRHSHACGSEIGEGLPDARKCLSSAERLHHRSYLQQPVGMSEERSRGGRLRIENSREAV